MPWRIPLGTGMCRLPQWVGASPGEAPGKLLKKQRPWFGCPWNFILNPPFHRTLITISRQQWLCFFPKKYRNLSPIVTSQHLVVPQPFYPYLGAVTVFFSRRSPSISKGIPTSLGDLLEVHFCIEGIRSLVSDERRNDVGCCDAFCTTLK